MSRKKPGLGKGLDAIIVDKGGFQDELARGGLTKIRVDKIKENPSQPRSIFNEGAISELAESIIEHGIIQPLIVSKGDKPDEYILIAGERRLLASKLAGLKIVPVVIRESSDQERLELALVENIQREDLKPLERAKAYMKLSEEFGLHHEAIGKRVGKSRETVTNTIRLLNLPERVQEALEKGAISAGHARTLLGLPTPQSQNAALDTILAQDLSVRKTEALVRRLIGEKPITKGKSDTDPEIKALEERLRLKLGTKVSLKKVYKGWSLTLHYYSDEELESILNTILPDEE
jgi:ParB family chromosome partitioning protein